MDLSVTTEEKAKEQVVLVVDREGLYTEVLTEKIINHATVVVVSNVKPKSAKAIHIPFFKRIPEIPQGQYSHIFFFSEGKEEEISDLLLPLTKKAQEDNAKFILVLPYWQYKDGFVEEIANSCRRWTVVLTGDIFDQTTIDSHIGKIFYQAKKKKTITLAELGLETVRPIILEETIDGILRVGFGLEKEKICFAFSKHSYTTLSIAHALQKIDPLIRIDFVGQSDSQSSSLLPQGTYLFEENYPAIKKIQEAYMQYATHTSVHEKEFAFENAVISKMERKRLKKRLPLLAGLISVIIFLFLPLVWTGVTGSIGASLLVYAKNQAMSGSLPSATNAASASVGFFAQAVGSGDLLIKEAGVLGLSQSAQALSLKLRAGYQLSQVLNLAISGMDAIQKVIDGKAQNPKSDFSEGTNKIKNALVILQQTNTSLLPKSLNDSLSQLQPIFNLVGDTIDVSSKILGFDKEKKYALLLLDNSELRPGGGFVVSYATFSLKKGKIKNLTTYDVSEADKQLKGHVEPPFAIRRYVPLEHWYLQDSYFSFDNVKNAQTAAFFLQQETGLQADGIIAVDFSFLKEVVALVGGVNIPSYNTTITTDNFLQQMQEHVGETTTNKQSFDTALLMALEQKIQNGKIPFAALLKQAILAMNQKHITLAFADQGIQQVFTVNNMSSALWDPRLAGEETINDLTAISEANLGINKENTFIKRQIDQSFVISPTGTVSGQLTITYQNISNGTPPGGIYKNYLRVLLAPNAQLTNISFNNVPQSRFPAIVDPSQYESAKFKPPKGVEIEQMTEEGKTGYGFLVQVPTKSTYTVTISYVLGQKFDLSQSSLTFDELLFKQPGTNADAYAVDLSYPSGWKIGKIPQGTLEKENNLSVLGPLDRDKDYTFTLVKQ